MIYYDPSEGRQGTRLQQAVISAGKKLNSLEALTGADLLVTPFDESFSIPSEHVSSIVEQSIYIVGSFHQNTDMKIAQQTGIPLPVILSVKKFWKACQYGILIQRKSGMDFTSSIPRLNEIVGRMLLWTPDPWLLIAANIGCDREGNAVIDGRASGFTHKQVVGAKMSWMFSGGRVIEISRDSLTTHVIEYAENKLKKLAENNKKLVIRQRWARQQIVGPNDPDWEWKNVLMNLQGIGQKRTDALAKYAGNLVSALVFLSDTDAVKELGRNDVARVSDSKKFRNLLGIADDNVLAEIGKYRGKND